MHTFISMQIPRLSPCAAEKALLPRIYFNDVGSLRDRFLAISPEMGKIAHPFAILCVLRVFIERSRFCRSGNSGAPLHHEDTEATETHGEFHASVITNRQNSWPPGKNFIGVLLGASRKEGLTVSRLAEHARCVRSQGRSPRPRVSAVRFGVQALACYGHRAA